MDGVETGIFTVNSSFRGFLDTKAREVVFRYMPMSLRPEQQFFAATVLVGFMIFGCKRGKMMDISALDIIAPLTTRLALSSMVFS